MGPVDARSYPVHAGSFPGHPGSYSVDGGSFPVHDGSFPLRCRSRCPCFATSYPDAYRRNHCSIDGKSTLHRRKIHAPSTPLITGSTPLLYPPKRLASPRLHLTLITVIVSPDSFFSFSLAFCPINFPFAPRHQQPYPTAILPHSPSRSIALYLYTSPSSSIYAVRASDSRFTTISLSLSLSQKRNAHKHAHTHTHTRIPLLLSPLFYFSNFFFFSFLNNQRQHCTRDIMNPSRRECIVCVDARMLHMPHTHKHTRIYIYIYKYIYAHVCMYTCIHTHKHAHTNKTHSQ